MEPGQSEALSLPPLVEQVSKLTEATVDGVFIYDAGLIIKASGKAAALFGLPHVASCPVGDLIAEASRPALLRHLQSSHTGPCPTLGRRQDGSNFLLEITLKANLTINGRRFQVLALRDLSQKPSHYRTDEELNRSRKDEQLAAAISLAPPQRN